MLKIVESELGQIYECCQCDAKYKERRKFANHFYRHVCQDQNEKPYVCNNCSKSFKNKSNLWRHNITEHEKDSKGLMNNVLKCETCDKTFLEKGKLNKHLIGHDYEVVFSNDKRKVFQCKICKENLNSKPEFNQHFYGLHLDKSVKTYKCYICERIYTDTWKLGEHLRGHETRKKLNYEIIHNSDSNTQYRCKKCQKTLISLYTFKKHFKDFHLPGRNDSPKSKSSEDNSNLSQVIPVDTAKKSRKIASFDISNIKLSGTDVLTIANIREDNDLIVNNTHLKLESENVYDEELETLYSVESNDIDPIGALDKEEKEFKMETEESILGI